MIYEKLQFHEIVGGMDVTVCLSRFPTTEIKILKKKITWIKTDLKLHILNKNTIKHGIAI